MIKNYIKGLFSKKFFIYFFRWQISALVMMPFMVILNMYGLPLWLNLMLGQAIGSLIFWEIDKYIFKEHKEDTLESNISNKIEYLDIPVPTESIEKYKGIL